MKIEQGGEEGIRKFGRKEDEIVSNMRWRELGISRIALGLLRLETDCLSWQKKLILFLRDHVSSLTFPPSRLSFTITSLIDSISGFLRN